MGRYAFHFDSRSCSGCKACQVACKDRHGLEVGILWRRVYEVSGGSWEKQGEAWQPQVYSYNLSVACNHCERAICVEACPAGAIYQRKDGIVLVNAERCLGCRYCSWVCPYGAPQYDFRARIMTKCNFCVDDVDAGQAPACVAACPLRVLDFGEQAELAQGKGVRSVAPLPTEEMTRPAMFIQPHKDTGQVEGGSLSIPILTQAAYAPAGAAHLSPKVLSDQKRVANREEVHSGTKSSELPLVIFTVLVQMAVGAFIILGALTGWAVWFGAALDMARRITYPPVLATGLIFGIGVTASFIHLGHPSRAYRAIFNIRSSWLSREILLVGIYGAVWAVFCGFFYRLPASTSLLWAAYGTAAMTGLALIYSMSRIYRLNSLPGGDSWRTPVAFYLTASMLGILFSGVMIAPRIPLLISNLQILFYRVGGLFPGAATISIILLAVDLIFKSNLEIGDGNEFWRVQLRVALNIGAMLSLAIILASYGGSWSPTLFTLAFILALVAQLFARWQYYKRLNDREL
jgi:DMSO reductase iron-sulfur subunit